MTNIFEYSSHSDQHNHHHRHHHHQYHHHDKATSNQARRLEAPPSQWFSQSNGFASNLNRNDEDSNGNSVWWWSCQLAITIKNGGPPPFWEPLVSFLVSFWVILMWFKGYFERHKHLYSVSVIKLNNIKFTTNVFIRLWMAKWQTTNALQCLSFNRWEAASLSTPSTELEIFCPTWTWTWTKHQGLFPLQTLFE